MSDPSTSSGYEWSTEPPIRAGYYWARLRVAPRDPKTGNELSRTIVVYLWSDEDGWHIQNNNRLYGLSEIERWGRRIETGQLSPEQKERHARDDA